MKRKSSIRIAALASILSGLLVVGGTSIAWSATAPVLPTATCIVRIASFAFSPDTAAEGDHVTLKLRLRNCTDKQQDVTVTQYGLQPPGCAVMDPVSRPVSVPAGGVVRSRSRMIAPSCMGVETMTTTVDSSTGMRLDSQTAQLTVT